MTTTKCAASAIAGSMFLALNLMSLTAAASPRDEPAVTAATQLAQLTEHTAASAKQAEVCTERRLVHSGHPGKGYDHWETVPVPCKDEQRGMTEQTSLSQRDTQESGKQAEQCTARRLVHSGHPGKGYDHWETVPVPCKDQQKLRSSRG